MEVERDVLVFPDAEFTENAEKRKGS